MDSLDRMFRHLTRTIKANRPEYLSRPFEVAELYQTIMPYRHHRRELGFDTNLDYELALLELLSGARGYLVVDERVRDTLGRALQAPNPDPGAFRQFATTQVALSADAVRALENTPGTRASGRTASVASPNTADTAAPNAGAGGTAPRTAAPARSATEERLPAAELAGESCRYCGGVLPAGRRIVFCPHCGQDLTVINCLACGTELELGWKFCITCGRPAHAATG